MIGDKQRKAIFAQIEEKKKIKEEQLKMTKKIKDVIE